MRWFSGWLNQVDIELRPRDLFKGRDIDIYPITPRGVAWLADNLEVFAETPTWSEWGCCLELSDRDALTLHSIVSKLSEAGLTVRRCGRLKRWDGTTVWLG
jgi:hypothetical protein